MSNIIQKQLEVYQKNFLNNPNDLSGTFQPVEAIRELRHYKIMKELLSHKQENFSICDVGSGLCTLHEYLTAAGISHKYTGIEIVPEMVEVSKKKFPGIELLNEDILSDSFNKKFDFVVLSGTFNIPGNVPKEEWNNFVNSVISKMFKSCEIAISFNCITTYVDFYDPDIHYINPLEMYDYIQKNLSRFFIVDNSYPLYEMSITVFNPSYLSGKYSSSAFDKYFKNVR